MRFSKIAKRAVVIGGVSLAAALALGGTANAAEPADGHQKPCKGIEAIGTVTNLKVKHAHGRTVYEFKLGKLDETWVATDKVPHIKDVTKGGRVDVTGCEVPKHEGTIMTTSVHKVGHKP